MSYPVRIAIELAIIIYCILALIHDYHPRSEIKSKPIELKILYQTENPRSLDRGMNEKYNQ